jgi:hypothetical protein
VTHSAIGHLEIWRGTAQVETHVPQFTAPIVALLSDLRNKVVAFRRSPSNGGNLERRRNKTTMNVQDDLLKARAG